MDFLVSANNDILQQATINDRILQLHEADNESPPEVLLFVASYVHN